MIKAEHSTWARMLYNPYINRLIKKSFSNFYLVNSIPNIPGDKSLIITPNHISWWDGFFIDFVSQHRLNRKLYLMILETTLKRFWFFRKLGAYSIEPANPRSIIDTIKYTNKILLDKRNFVVTYPQGEIEPFGKRPLSIKEGLKLFLKENTNQKIIMPVGFKIQYYNEKKPAVLCRFGEQLEGTTILQNYDDFKEKFVANLDLLNEAAYNRTYIEDILL